MFRFLLAKIHIDSLSTKNTVKAVEEVLHWLPQDLKHTYDDAMHWIEMGAAVSVWRDTQRLLAV
jgi:hypothetical protein